MIIMGDRFPVDGMCAYGNMGSTGMFRVTISNLKAWNESFARMRGMCLRNENHNSFGGGRVSWVF